MQQSSAVSETPASGAGPERRPPFPWASCPLCSRSELPPDGEHRTERLGPCGPRTDVHCVDFLGLDQLKYLLATSCAPSPALGLQTQKGSRGPYSGKQPSPSTERGLIQAPRASTGPQAPSTSRHKGLRGGVLGAVLHPDTRRSAPHSPPMSPTLATHAHQRIDCSSGALCTGYAALLRNSSDSTHSEGKHAGSGAGAELKRRRCHPASQRPQAGHSASRSLHFLTCQTEVLKFAPRARLVLRVR